MHDLRRDSPEGSGENPSWTVRERRRDRGSGYMKRVSDRRKGGEDFSADVWSVRPDFNPRHRFFGVFFREDWFVVLAKKPRDSLKRDEHWHAQIDLVCREWDNLFPFRPRHGGEMLSDYVTFN